MEPFERKDVIASADEELFMMPLESQVGSVGRLASDLGICLCGRREVSRRFREQKIN